MRAGGSRREGNRPGCAVEYCKGSCNRRDRGGQAEARGVSHEWAFFISLGLGAALIIAAETPQATLAVAIYAVSLSALFGTSALYHRVDWRRPNVRRWMRRLDHSMIFFLIAGTYTPFALLVLDGPLADAVLAVVWVGAVIGAIVEIVWIEHPKWVAALVYISLGWVAVDRLPGPLGPDGIGGNPAGRRRRASSTRSAPSSTRPSARTPTRGSSATTRSSTCS